jgi:uncharacterized protein
VASGLLTILDDVTVVLDDVAAMSKVAAKKTAGLLGDDLAVNANVVVGLNPKRELPIVGKVALGSLANKAVLVPLALAVPTRVIGPILLFGGAFLCFEALHKVFHRNDKKTQEHRKAVREASHESAEELMKLEKKKVWGAIQTDTILSTEILAVALGAVATAPLLTKAITLIVISLCVVIGVYGTVALIVKMDDIGLRLQEAGSRAVRGFGAFLVKSMPYFMRFLSFVGTAAMLLVGGGIALHGIPGLGHGVENFIGSVGSHPMLSGLLTQVANLIAGVAYGLIAYPLFTGLTKAFGFLKKSFTDESASRTVSSTT